MPSGDSPDGMGRVPQTNGNSAGRGGRPPLPVGESPTGTGGSPVPPNFQTVSKQLPLSPAISPLAPRGEREKSECAQSKTAWITGAGGLIGSHLVRTAATFAPNWQVRGLTRDQLDLADFDAVRRAFQQDAPALIIHCAAMSRSPACQQNPALAHKLNVDVTARLAELAAEIPFVLFSTDLVFDGRAGNYDESATVNPLNVYAATKVAAEKIVLANPRHTVIRTSLNFGASPTGDRGFGAEMRQAWSSGQTLKLFTDEFRNPIPAVVTACAVWELVAQNSSGLFHLAGAEKISRWQIGQLLAARCPELHPRLEASSLRDYQGPTRSANTTLNCAKIQQRLSFPLPGFTAWLAAHPDEPFS